MIAIGPSPPPSSLAGRSVGRSLLAQKSAPIDGSVGECERRNNGKKQCRMQTDRKTHSATHSNDGGEKARRRLTTSPLLSLPLFSFRVRRRCCCRFRGSFFSSLPSHFHLRSAACEPFFPPPANAHWSRRALLARSCNGASRPAAPFGAKTAESAIAGCAPSSFVLPRPSFLAFPPSLSPR